MSDQPTCKKQSPHRKKQSDTAKYKLIFELAADAIFIGSPVGEFIDVNESAVSLTGYSKKELLQKSMSSLFAKEDLKSTPLRYDLIKAGKIVRTDRRLIRKDGTIIPVEMNSRMLPDGTLQAVIRDNSARRKMELELEDLLARQQAIIDAAFEAIFIFIDGICVSQNQCAEDLFGYSFEEAVGRHATEWVVRSERERVEKNVRSGFEGLYECVGLRKDGSEFPIEIQARMTTFDGKPARITAARDIATRKKAENDLLTIQKLESIGTLAGGLAHDLNNILTGLFGNISLAKIHLRSEDKAYKFLAKAEESLSRFTRITNKLLTFSKGGQPVIQSVKLTELVQDIVQFDLAGSNVRAHLNSEKGLWNAKVDTGQIQQVFSNLIINANQAMVNGGQLSIDLSNCDNTTGFVFNLKPGRYVKIDIADEGCGIAQEHLTSIFDPYFTTKQTGSGLGLTSVHSIVSKHGGLISVSSKVGEGTRFTLYLPADIEDMAIRISEESDTPVKLKKGYKILLVDDDETVCTICSNLLKSLNCSVVTANNESQAVKAFKKAEKKNKPFDLAILDLTIPGEAGGVKTVKELLQINPETKMIVSSGYSDNPVMANFQKHGFSAILSKPYTLNELHGVLQQLEE